MLNRRLVRIRVMQTLYAYEKACAANYLLAIDQITEHFAPDLNAVVRQDRNVLTGNKKIALSYLEDQLIKKQAIDESELNIEIKMALKSAKEHYLAKNKKDFDYYKRQILFDAEKTYDIYLYLLSLLLEVSKRFEKQTNFHKNRVITALESTKDLQLMCLKKGIKWDNEASFLTKFYNEAFKSNAHILEYQEKVNCTSETDLAIIKYVIKNILLKHESSEEYFEKISIFWQEDKEILRTMLFHTFSDFIENNAVKIETLDETWDETKEFMSDLFIKTVQNEDKNMSYIEPKLKNWDFDRVINTDRILLKMAVTELTEFSSIPVKVTINEVIDISKNYGSEKSGPFLNGILDTLHKSLVADGAIKKTGRGMMDNK